MKIGKKLYVDNRKDWRKWLRENGQKEKEIWLVYYKKDSGKKRIPYDDAVEEALCYGWIDSTVKSVDSESFAQRFTPRKSTSVLSELNRERVKMLIRKNKMTKRGLRALSHVFNPKKDLVEKFILPKRIEKELIQNEKTWEHFQNFSESYKRIRIGYILSQKKHGNEAYKKALQNFIKKTEQNKKFGMGKDL